VRSTKPATEPGGTDIPRALHERCGLSTCKIAALERVAHQPEHGRPEADEERAALGVSALALIVGLRAYPEADAEADRGHRGQMEVPAAQPDPMNEVHHHAHLVPARTMANHGSA
jgi:hypothetical protein